MHPKHSKRLVEVCPQCCQSVVDPSYRVVQDTCGHSKCRICLLQEINGCLLCSARQDKHTISEPISNELTPRKSVITSLALQIAEKKETPPASTGAPASPPIFDKEACQIINQSLEKEILFPTEIVKRSTGNFYHLKRIFSERFFNDNKEHKACETEKEWSENVEMEVKEPEEVRKNEVMEADKVQERAMGWHIPSHIEVKYYCTVHKVSFRQKHNIIRNHMTCTVDRGKVELGSNCNVQCKVCNKSYKAVGKLIRHMKTHTNIEQYKCPTCAKQCVDTYSLTVHQRTHTKERPYTCCYCDKTFAVKHNHQRHEKKHKNEKNFVCNDCGFQFITKTELKAHSVVHSGSKQFVCMVCDNKFAFKRTLLRHQRTHLTDCPQVQCYHCEATFKRKDNLERHIKNTHTETKIDG